MLYWFSDPASGNSVDFAYNNANIKFSYAIELRDRGKNGKQKDKNLSIFLSSSFIH